MRVALTIDEGEVIAEQPLEKDEIIEVRKKKKELSPKQLKIVNQKQDLKKHCSHLGGFVHMLCVRNELLFNDLEIDRADISRLIYLATYIDYNNRKENLLVVHRKGQSTQIMTRATMQKLLKLSNNSFNVFIKNMKENNLIFEANKKFYITSEYFTKGKTKFDKKKYTRLFVDTTRNLFENVTPRQHKMLGYAFQLVPFCHYELNILCKNPLETNLDLVEKLSLEDICTMLNISTDRSQMTKFRNNLSRFTVKIEGSKYSLFAHNTVRTTEITDYFVINPAIVWAGNDTDRAREKIKVCYFSS